MKYLYKDIILPKWLSYRTYFPTQDNSRTYIFNERKHTYIQLDEISSDFWYSLSLGEKEFQSFLKEKSLTDAADDFLETLAEQDLILLAGLSSQNGSVCEKFNTENSDDHIHFIEDMNKWLYENGFMSSIFFELTYRCNLKCIHCYNPKNISDMEIPFESIKTYIDEAYDLGCFTVILSGGEATTYSHFTELICYVRDKHMSLEVFSNGLRLAESKSLYKNLIDVYPHKIGVSLYSINEKSHEKVTAVTGSYNKTKEIIKQLRNDGVFVQIKNFLLSFTCRDCIKTAMFGKRINANVTADISLIPTINGNKKTLEYALSDNDLYYLFVNPKSPLFIGENPYLFNKEEHKKESLCFGGFSGVCVSPDLEVHICVSLPMSLGNLKNESLTKIWSDAKSKKKNSKLYQWRSKTIDDLKECYNESYCRFCHYCAGMGYLENGYLRKSDILCSQAKAKEKAYNYLCEQRKLENKKQ